MNEIRLQFARDLVDTAGQPVTIAFADNSHQVIEKCILIESPIDDFAQIRSDRYAIRFMKGEVRQGVDEGTTFTFVDGRQFIYTGNRYFDRNFEIYQVDKA